MANEENKNTQNQSTENQDTQNSTSSTTDFGSPTTDFGGGSDLTVGSGQSFGSSTGSSGSTSSGTSGTSARQAKEGAPLTTTSEGSDSSVTDTVKSTARGIIDQAKDTAGQAYGVATEKAATKLEEQKATLATGLTSVADSLKQVGGSLRETDDQSGITELTAKYGESLANQIEQISGYFERKDVREMVRDVESFARRNPALFIGGAFTLGLLAARFLKSSGAQQSGNTGRRSLSTNRATSQTFDNESFDTGSGSTGGAETATNRTTNPS
jgi:hypothetical protein